MQKQSIHNNIYRNNALAQKANSVAFDRKIPVNNWQDVVFEKERTRYEGKFC